MVIAVHVAGPATGRETAACFLRLTSRVVGGGSATYCLTDFRGTPGANAVVRVRGEVVFRLAHRTITARVMIVDRFAADGKHARQSLAGTLAGGGTIAGGGTFVEDTPGHVRASDLRYRVSYR